MKYLNDLNKEELKIVFNKNKKLREIVFNSFVETCEFYIKDFLNCFEHGSISYDIDVCGYYDYFTVKNYTKFLEGLENAQKWYCFCLMNIFC